VRVLSVMPVVAEDLFEPPTVGAEGTMLDARREVAGADSRWAVVLESDGTLLGWVDLDPKNAGSVTDHVRPFDVSIPLGASLRTALAEMLEHDVRWVPVVEDGRYLGVLTPNALHAAMRRSVGGHAL